MTAPPPKQAPNAPSAIINALAEEGSRDRLIHYMQVTWNEYVQVKAERDKAREELAALREDAERHRFMRLQSTADRQSHAWASTPEAEKGVLDAALRKSVRVVSKDRPTPRTDGKLAECHDAAKAMDWARELERELHFAMHPDPTLTGIAALRDAAFRHGMAATAELARIESENVALRAEVEALRHDIERHVRIASELATENAKLWEALRDVVTAHAKNNPGEIRCSCAQCVSMVKARALLAQKEGA